MMIDIVNFVTLAALLIIIGNGIAKYVIELAQSGKPKQKHQKFAVASFLGCDPCPTGTLPSVSEIACSPDFTRFTRLFFQKRTTPQDSFTETNIVTQSSWISKLTATNDTKIVPTPRNRLKRLGVTPGDFIRTTDTPTGTERTLGKVLEDKVVFTFENLAPSQFKELQELFCYPLVVFFATADNVVWAKQVIATTNYQGFPVYGRVIMNTPEISGDLVAQPRNFMVEFTMEDVFWYSQLREFKTNFINLL